MRKAASLGGIRGSRKKQQPPAPPEPKENRPHVVSNNIPMEPSYPPAMEMQQHRKKPTSEETALTSKNYRLAKELSELRVRHREECKNVTRLTMENMNLASRCREAISHVAMLKKELAMHQRRAEESLALQRAQTQRIASNLSAEVSRLGQSFEDEDTMGFPDAFAGPDERDRILASLSNTPPRRPPPTAPLNEERVENVPGTSSRILTAPSSSPCEPPVQAGISMSPTGALSLEGVVNPRQEDVFSYGYGDAVNNDRRTVSPHQHFSPASSSTAEDKIHLMASGRQPRKDSDEEIAEDGNGDEPQSLTLFPRTASPKGHSSKEYNEEFPADVIPRKNHRQRIPRESPDEHADVSVSSKDSGSSSGRSTSGSEGPGRRPDLATLSSIDAFEASFDTTFPPVFSPKDDELIRKARPPAGIYNPFVSSPDKLLASVETDPIMEPSVLYQPVLLDERLMEDDVDSSPMKILDTLPSASSPPRSARVSQANTPEERKADPSDIGYSTPPHGSQAVPEFQNSGQLKRPEKMVPESARARYEKALQPRTSGTKSGKEGHGKSPSLSVNTLQTEPFESNLVKRAQQQRVKQYMHRMSDPDAISRQSHGSDSNEVSREYPGRSDSARSINEQPFDEIEDGPWFSLSSKSENGINHNSFNNTFGSSMVQDRSEESLAESSGLAAMKLRRNVRQPVSYAEPALNTKLRKGDLYFTKEEQTPAPLVTPDAGRPVKLMFR